MRLAKRRSTNRRDKSPCGRVQARCPITSHLKQLRNYMRHLPGKPLQAPRRLVHGGALKLAENVRKEAAKKQEVEIVRYTLKVDLTGASKKSPV